METPKRQKPRKPKKTTPDGPSLIELVERYHDTESARTYLESVRWSAGRVCPHCGVVNESADLGGAAAEKGLYWCRACSKKFTVTVGTIFEDSHIPLHKWVIAFHLISANKKGISALSLQRMLNLGSYRTAWHMCHRIRHAMQDLTTEPMSGVIEVDETYVGGTAANAHNGKPTPPKTPVVALVQRDGKVRARAVTNVDETTIGPMLKEKIAAGSLLMTDGSIIYVNHVEANGAHYSAHKSVAHSRDEYVRVEDDGFKAHTNTVESFNSMVKRCIMGAWHNVSDRHLDKYLDEVSFRWNTRDVSDGERMEQAIRQSEGRRLPLRPMKSKPAVQSSPLA